MLSRSSWMTLITSSTSQLPLSHSTTLQDSDHAGPGSSQRTLLTGNGTQNLFSSLEVVNQIQTPMASGLVLPLLALMGT